MIATIQNAELAVRAVLGTCLDARVARNGWTNLFVKNAAGVTIAATVKPVRTVTGKTSKVCVITYKITAIFAMDWRMSLLASATFVMDVQVAWPSVDGTMVGIEERFYVCKYDCIQLLNVNR